MTSVDPDLVRRLANAHPIGLPMAFESVVFASRLAVPDDVPDLAEAVARFVVALRNTVSDDVRDTLRDNGNG